MTYAAITAHLNNTRDAYVADASEENLAAYREALLAAHNYRAAHRAGWLA